MNDFLSNNGPDIAKVTLPGETARVTVDPAALTPPPVAQPVTANDPPTARVQLSGTANPLGLNEQDRRFVTRGGPGGEVGVRLDSVRVDGQPVAGPTCAKCGSADMVAHANGMTVCGKCGALADWTPPEIPDGLRGVLTDALMKSLRDAARDIRAKDRLEFAAAYVKAVNEGSATEGKPVKWPSEVDRKWFRAEVAHARGLIAHLESALRTGHVAAASLSVAHLDTCVASIGMSLDALGDLSPKGAGATEDGGDAQADA